MEYSTVKWTIDSLLFSTVWCRRWLCLWLWVRYFCFRHFSYQINSWFYHAKKLILILVLIHWLFMMVIQIHHPCWSNIVGIPCHPAKSLQATISFCIFILVLLALELDSNWNTVRPHYQAIPISANFITKLFSIVPRNTHSVLFFSIYLTSH